MDWYLDRADREGFSRLRRDFAAYLRRHGERDSDFTAAELAFAEVVGNALRHADGAVWVSVEWEQDKATLVVDDLGPGFDLEEVAGSRDLLADGPGGLAFVSELAGGVRVRAKAGGGSRVEVDLPARRSAEESHDPPPHHEGALPVLEEARDDGTFDRESFLRALVVQLAQHVERRHGPSAAAAAVAQVGTDTGGQMEAAYRRARGIVEPLSPEDMADLFVRLKHAIDGDFYVIEANDDRIVLGNRRCPFGEAVKRSPTLCRMTTSVFGGIAARNTGESSVQLEERIAVGDPHCRVVVSLRPAGVGRSAPRYANRPPARRGGQIRILLAEHSGLLRDALRRSLAEAEIEVAATATTASDVLIRVRAHDPDAVILDLREADTATAVELARDIRRRYPNTGLVVLAESAIPRNAADLFAEADGIAFLLKERMDDATEVIDAVRAVVEGRSRFDAELLRPPARDDPLEELTAREREVLELIAAGLSNQAIAERLVITKRAVEKHVGSIFRKLRLRARDGDEPRVLAARLLLGGASDERLP